MKKTRSQVNPGQKTNMSFAAASGLLLFMLSVMAVLPAQFAGRAWAQEEGEAFKNPHNFAKKELCDYCHKGVPPSLMFDPVTTCARCHPGNVGNHPVTMHPVGVVPKIHIPGNLPLTGEGKLVCYTCHDPHNRTNYRYMLRIEYHRLCMSCHVGY